MRIYHVKLGNYENELLSIFKHLSFRNLFWRIRHAIDICHLLNLQYTFATAEKLHRLEARMQFKNVILDASTRSAFFPIAQI